LTVGNRISLTGTGINGTGALHSISGINKWTGPVTLQVILPPPTLISAAIGVDADPNASNTNDYFTHDYSLTIIGNVGGANLVKVGAGQLILPSANTYTGTTTISEGWITIQNNFSLGAFIGGGGTIQPKATGPPRAAPPPQPPTPGAPLNPAKNHLPGRTGITHPLAPPHHKGALESLGGLNTVGGPVDLGTGGIRSSDIQLNGVAGIGVEMPDPATPDGPSELTITSSISDFASTAGGLTKSG